MSMTMQPVTSSNLSEVGYDPDARKLAVKFKGGGLYHYSDVPPEAHQRFMATDSKGKHHSKFIVGAFRHEKVV